MRRWFIGTNNYWYFSNIYLEKTPWYLVFAESFIMHLCGFISKLDIKILPKRLLEDYGDWGGLFHVFVCDPVVQFVWKKTQSTIVELPYFFLKEKFPKSFEEDDDQDDDQKINEERAKTLDKEFRNAYNNVIEHSTCFNKKGKEKEQE